jgi:hypothetical protein
VTGKVVDVAPAATATVPGNAADELLLESVTTMPAAGAALVNVTVPSADSPPMRDVVSRASWASAVVGGVTTSGRVVVDSPHPQKTDAMSKRQPALRMSWILRAPDD